MSTVQGGAGNIVTNGLVLYLDAANINSYISGSTTWRDISSGGNNGTLINGPTFNSSNGGSIVFDGVDDYVNCGNSNQLKFLGTSSYTVEVVINQQTLQSGFPMIWANDGITPREGTSLIITNTLISLGRWVGSSNQGTSVTRSFPEMGTGIPISIVTTFNGVNSSIYINGLIRNTNTLSLSLTNVPEFIIGKRGGISPGNQFNGTVYICKVYNRALSAAEVLQNFNSTRARFGI